MERSEAVEIVRSLVSSIEAQPGQFHLNIRTSMVGQNVVNSGSGTGMVVTAHGGGPGSSVIGNQVSLTVGDAEISIAQAAANTAVEQQMQALVTTLNRLIGQLESSQPDRGLIATIIQSLRDNWVPPLINSVLSTVVGLVSL